MIFVLALGFYGLRPGLKMAKNIEFECVLFIKCICLPTGISRKILLVGVSKKLTRLMGRGVKRMLPMFKIEMLTTQSKTNLDAKIVFGKVSHLTHLTQSPKNKQNAGKGLVWKWELHVQFWSMIYMQLTLKFYFWKWQFYWFQIAPESNVDVSFSYQYFPHFWV